MCCSRYLNLWPKRSSRSGSKSALFEIILGLGYVLNEPDILQFILVELKARVLVRLGLQERFGLFGEMCECYVMDVYIDSELDTWYIGGLVVNILKRCIWGFEVYWWYAGVKFKAGIFNWIFIG